MNHGAVATSQVVPDTVAYIGPVLDLSGYGLAARHYAASLAAHHPRTRIQNYNFTGKQVEGHDRVMNLVRSHTAKDQTIQHRAPIRIVHTPPRDFATHRLTTSYNIGNTVWETTRLSPDWTQRCNLMDEIWVPSHDNREWFRASGVSKPIYVIPHILPDIPVRMKAPRGFEFLSAETRFVFYNVFVWQPRKNPQGTLATYLSEFTSRDKVLLVLKVSDAEQARKEVREIIKLMNLHDPPEVRCIDGYFTDAEMAWIHKYSDCYYQLQHSEGWGLPHFEALAHGNYLITTAFGGPKDFMDQAFVDAGCCYPIGGFLTPVMQAYRYYSGRQKWLQPDVEQAGRAMRIVYQMGKRKFPEVAEVVRDRYSFDRVGAMMKQRIDEIVSRKP